MNILIITNKVPFPPKDGGAIATSNLAKGLAASGQNVSMLAMNTRKHYIDNVLIDKDMHAGIQLESLYVDNRVKWIPLISNLLFSRKPYIAVRFESRKFANKLRDIIVEREFDIVQLETPYLLYYVPLIRRYSGARISYRANNVEYVIWERLARKSRNPLKKYYLAILAARIKKQETRFLKELDLILPISEGDRLILEGFAAKKPIHLTPFGLDSSRYSPTPVPEQSTVVFIGALDWLPNIQGLIWFVEKVWERIVNRVPEAQLIIAGRNPQISSELFVNKKQVTFLGEVEDSRELIRSGRILIVPLFSGSGVRVKILEILALNRPLVSTSVGAEGLDLVPGKHYLKADDARSFASAVVHLLQDKERCIRLTEEGRKIVREKFDIFAITANLASFYKQML